MQPRRAPRVTFFVLALGGASFALLQNLLNPVLPTIQHDLNTNQSTASWILIAWILSAAIATPLLGRVGDMIGKRRTFVLALAAVVAGSVLAALAPTIGILILARVIQGLGGAVFPLSFGIIRDEFPAARVSSAIGAMSAVIAVGGGLGVVLAGPIVGALDWRWLFWIPAIVSTATATLAHFVIPESPTRSGGRINWLAAALLAAWLIALLLPLSEASQWGWSSPVTIGMLVAAALLLVAWITYEWRTDNPVIDMRMMRIPAVWTVNLVALFFGATMFAIYAFVPQFTQTPTSAGYGFGASVTGAGLLMLPLLASMAIGGFAAGPLSRRIGFKIQLTGGAALGAVSAFGLAFLHDQAWQVAIEAGILGVGLGFGYSAMTSMIVRAVPATQTGAASGMNANIRTIGGAIGTAVMTTIVTGSVTADGIPVESGYTTSFLNLGGLAVVAVGVSAAIPSVRRAARTAAAEAERYIDTVESPLDSLAETR